MVVFVASISALRYVLYISGHSVTTQRDKWRLSGTSHVCMYGRNIDTILLWCQQGRQCMHNVTVWRVTVTRSGLLYLLHVQTSHFAGMSFGAKQETDIKFVDMETQQWVLSVLFSYKMSPCEQYIKFFAMETQQWVPSLYFSYKMSPCEQYIKFVAMETQQWVPSLYFSYKISPSKQYIKFVAMETQQWVLSVLFSYKMSPSEHYIKSVDMKTQQWVPFVLSTYKMSPSKKYIKFVAMETQQWLLSVLLTSYIRCCQQYKT